MKRWFLVLCIGIITGNTLFLWINTYYAPKTSVLRLINEFGKKLQNAPLQAPREVLVELMTENYGACIAKVLLAQWIDDPSRALGRRGSSL